MNLALTPYLFALFTSVTVCWFLTFFTRRRHHVPAVLPFASAMFAAGMWAFFYGLELIAVSLETKLIWFNLKQLGASFLGPLLLVFVLKYTNQRLRYPKLLYAVLILVPILSQLIFWTNPWHGWAGSPHLATDLFPFPLLVFEYGPWFWLSIFVGYFLFTTSVLILVVQFPTANHIYRKQLLLILLGLIIPWLAGVLSLFGLGNLDLFDITTFMFPVSGVLISLGLLRHHFLGLMPVAYTAVFSGIRDGILIIDNEFRIMELNPAAINLLGLPESKLLGQFVYDIFPVWQEEILTHKKYEPQPTLEFYYERAGQYRFLEIHGGRMASSIYLASGYVLILYDVTDRKFAEKSRQMSEDRYRTIFETDSAATIIIEEDMTIQLANDQFAALSGFPRKEIEGKMRWTTFVHPEDLDQMIRYHQARRQADSLVPNEYEFRFVNRDGRIKNVFASVAMVPDSTISIASLLDITDRIRLEQSLAQRATDLEAEIRSEQERSAIILQSVKDAIAVSDLEFKIIYANEAFIQQTGYSIETITGQPAYFILNGRIPTLLWDSIQAALADQTVWEGELQFKRENGTVYDAAVLIAPMRDGNGRLVGYVSSHRDITEAKRLQAARLQFVTNISHELRTPVTNLKLYIELLQRNINKARQSHYFEILQKQIQRLETIIQSTLEIVSLEDNKKELVREPINWESLRGNLQIRLKAQAEAKEVELHISPDIDLLPKIIGDPQRIGQALYELIHNAITFASPGGQISLIGMVKSEDQTHWLTISVCDDGPGIDFKEQRHIFDRFYRGRQAVAGNIPGTGLGLSMVNLIAQAHNGRVTLESTPGQGSNFTLWLPLS